MVLCNLNVVLSNELSREGRLLICMRLNIQLKHGETQTSGLLDMPDLFWMRCQEVLYPLDAAQA